MSSDKHQLEAKTRSAFDCKTSLDTPMPFPFSEMNHKINRYDLAGVSSQLREDFSRRARNYRNKTNNDEQHPKSVTYVLTQPLTSSTLNNQPSTPSATTTIPRISARA